MKSLLTFDLSPSFSTLEKQKLNQAMTLTVSGNTSSSDSSIRLMDNTSGSIAAPLVDALPTSEQSLLAKLEAANKLIESDAKSLNSLQGSAHSRKSSDTSQISLNSGKNGTYSISKPLERAPPIFTLFE